MPSYLTSAAAQENGLEELTGSRSKSLLNFMGIHVTPAERHDKKLIQQEVKAGVELRRA